jgi:hypothetical protein
MHSLEVEFHVSSSSCIPGRLKAKLSRWTRILPRDVPFQLTGRLFVPVCHTKLLLRALQALIVHLDERLVTL